ncbi:hypothetical protein [Actinomadura livida]|uniref:DUF2273 domain-containing protein n=1 Tax=Actinomadura livida TaxID=79909 RepID=A0A7W7II69_9ACTN|nr:hypothetical protein [Actinomadura catellatispora]GGU00260.1 hypothetical protein GCM10010208_25120 [Actinomadura livida]
MDMRLLWPLVGMAFGVALGFAGAFGGFGPFFIVLFLGALGFLVGRAIEGDLDLGRLLGTGRRSR